jgi:hypothetical protein
MSLDFGKIKRFLTRILIYQVVLLWPFMKINNLDKHSVDFKEKLLRNFSFFGIQNKTFNEYAEDPNLLMILCGAELIVGIFAIFGSFYGNLLSAILFLLNCVIYFNPLLAENKISLYETRIEVLYNIGIFLAILLCAFYSNDKVQEKTQSIQEIIDANEGYVEEKVIPKNKRKTDNFKKQKKNK